MKALENMIIEGHEQVVYCNDSETGLRAIIAIHDTTLGPAVGGTRFWPYESEDDALYDVLRLSKGMSLKNAAADLKIGGGKAVIIGDPKKLKSEAFFRAYGRFVNSLNGKYFTAEDVNTTDEDMANINKETNFVIGLPHKSGNPSPFTALGVYRGIKAAAYETYNTDDLHGLTIAISGVGTVGGVVADYVAKEGANIIVADINQDRVDEIVEKYDAQAVSITDILTVDCDIFAPCALGAVINKENAYDLKCKIIAGAANNVLVTPEAGDALHELGILYVPDYIINAGGIINCEAEIRDAYDVTKVTAKVDEIYDTVLKIIKKAKDENIPTYKAADIYAQEIIDAAK